MNYFMQFLKVLIYCGICASVFFIGYYFDIARLEAKLTTAQQAQFVLKSQLRVMGYQQISLEEKIARLPEVEDMLENWQTRFIRPKDVEKLFKEFERLGKAKHLQFNAFATGDQQVGKYYQRLPVSLNMTGNYIQLTEFFEEIARLPWLVEVGDFAAVSVGQQNFGGSVALAIYQVR